MRALTIIVVEASPIRFRGALVLATAHAALGGFVTLFLEGPAAALARTPLRAPEDDASAAAGLPTLAQMFDEALAADVRIIVCQSGMHLAGISAAACHPQVTQGGMIGILAALGDGRLVVM